MDGNFEVSHQKMKKGEEDVALADGHSYMVPETEYKEHLKTAVEIAEVKLQILIGLQRTETCFRNQNAIITRPLMGCIPRGNIWMLLELQQSLVPVMAVFTQLLYVISRSVSGK
jgi:hypothetical protein